MGCECGLVKIAMINVMDLQVSQSWLLRYDKPIPSVLVFPHQNFVHKPAFINTNGKYISTQYKFIYVILIYNSKENKIAKISSQS